MKKTEDKKMKGIDASCFVTALSEYDTSDSIHIHPRDAQQSSQSCDLCKDIIPINDVLTVNRCKHSFCHPCFQAYLAKTIQQNIHEIRCPASKCKTIITNDSCGRLVPDQVFDRWKSSLIEASALEECNMIMCPNHDCRRLFLDDGKMFLIRACPKCCKLFCSRCRVEWHANLNCAQFQRSRSRRTNHPFLRRWNF